MQTGLEIAVLGMAGRFPGARNLDEFWNNLKNGKETISFFPDNELKDMPGPLLLPCKDPPFPPGQPRQALCRREDQTGRYIPPTPSRHLICYGEIVPGSLPFRFYQNSGKM